MRATLYPVVGAPQTVEVLTYQEIQKLLGGEVVVASETSLGDVLVNLDSRLPNPHFQGRYVGLVILAPKGWSNLPST